MDTQQLILEQMTLLNQNIDFLKNNVLLITEMLIIWLVIYIIYKTFKGYFTI
jgi:hypothetical protein